MAKPRVFVSSTFYDLKYIRNEIETFVRRMGYDPVLNERGRVPFPSDRKLDESCYQEVDNCDILVAIIGGRLGTQSSTDPSYSVSQEEIRRAHKRNKQIFVFVENSVFYELQTFKKNKGNSGINYHSVDSTKIFEFIEEIEGLPRNNAIASFESADNITTFLREQWAGMMYEMLQFAGKSRDLELTQRLESMVGTLERAVKELGTERSNGNSSLLAAHPIFNRLKMLLKVKYRVFFISRSELNDWLKARSFKGVDRDAWDDGSAEEWINNSTDETYQLLKVKSEVFDENGQLNLESIQNWHDDWVSLETRSPTDEAVTVSELAF